MVMYDVIIIGSGPAGLVSAMYTSRLRLKNLVISDMNLPSQILFTEKIENFPGFSESINPAELLDRFKRQAQNFGANFLKEKVIKIEKEGNFWVVKTNKGSYKTISIIVASGAHPKKLGVEGEDKFLGKGVSYCAVCDAPFFKDKEIVVVGGGDTAVEETLYLAKFARKITLIHRRNSLRATKILQERLFSLSCLKIEWNSVLKKIEGKESIEKVKIVNIQTQKEKEISCQGVFIFVGIAPNTEFLKDIVDLDKNGFVIVDKKMRTSQEGIFSCGDCTDISLRQVVVAAGCAAIASISAKEYIEKVKGIEYK